MSSFFGLHFGNTNLCLAIHKDGKIDTVANDAGDRVTPAIVAFVNGEKCIGLPAKHRMVRFPNSIVKHLKRSIGSQSSEKKEDDKHEVEDGDEIRNYGCEEILEFMFKKMHSFAVLCDHSSNSYPMVVTVPLHFTKNQKATIRKCAEKVGFEVLRIISEPVASILAYDLGHHSDLSISNCLVYRIGATTLDVTVVRIVGGTYRIVSQVRCTDLGGDAFTKQLVDFCVQEFKRQYKVDVCENKRAVAKLWNVAENCKHGLSMVGTALCCAESLYDGLDLNLNVSRARYESLISPVVQACLQPITEVLSKGGLTEDDIHKVILSGGSAKIVLLQQSLQNCFKTAEMLSNYSPDEVIAIGAAKQAAITVASEDTEQLEAVSRTIYLKAIDGNNETSYLPVINKGTPVPTKWHHKLTLPIDQTNVTLDVYEGVTNQDRIEKPVHLAKVVMKDIPAGSDIPVTLQIKTDGNLYISCLEKTTSKTECVTVHRSLSCS